MKWLVDLMLLTFLLRLTKRIQFFGREGQRGLRCHSHDLFWCNVMGQPYRICNFVWAHEVTRVGCMHLLHQSLYVFLGSRSCVRISKHKHKKDIETKNYGAIVFFFFLKSLSHSDFDKEKSKDKIIMSQLFEIDDMREE